MNLDSEDPAGLQYLIEESADLALRSGNWKYVEPTRVKSKTGERIPLQESLFDLGEDPSERKNLIAQYPEKAKRMKALLESLKQGDGLRQSFQ